MMDRDNNYTLRRKKKMVITKNTILTSEEDHE